MTIIQGKPNYVIKVGEEAELGQLDENTFGGLSAELARGGKIVFMPPGWDISCLPSAASKVIPRKAGAGHSYAANRLRRPRTPDNRATRTRNHMRCFRAGVRKAIYESLDFLQAPEIEEFENFVLGNVTNSQIQEIYGELFDLANLDDNGGYYRAYPEDK